jgi:hypothetical protein
MDQPQQTTARRWKTALELIIIIISVLMFVSRGHGQQGSSVDVAVLQTRANAQDIHLSNTDKLVADLTDKVNKLSDHMSEQAGEERAAWALIGLLGGGSIYITNRKKKEN